MNTAAVAGFAFDRSIAGKNSTRTRKIAAVWINPYTIA